MKNIDYLTLFFRKHNLSGRIKVRYDRPGDDDYMSNIEFENGDIINIHDIIFDIESELPEDMVSQWMKSKRETGISLMDWMQTDNHYMPEIDTSSVREYQEEMNSILEEVKETIDKVFNLEIDEGDSDIEEDGD